MQDWDGVWLDINIMTMSSIPADPYGVIYDGAIAVKNEKIAWIGKRHDLPKFDALAIPVYKGNQAWVTPGLIDPHTHLIFAGSRANDFEMRQQGKSYQEIAIAGGGILSTVEATRQATEEELFHLARKRLNAFLKEGVTTIEIKSGYGLDTETEVKILKVAKQLSELHPMDISTTFLGAHALPPEFKDRSDEYIDLIINDMLPRLVDEQLADAVDVYCENIAFSKAQTEKILIAAKSYGLPIKLHAEQLSNQGASLLAASMGALSVDHLEYLDEPAIKIMQQTGTCATLLPGAFFFLKETQLPPVEQLRQYQIPIALGSDFNPGTSPFCSTLLMLNFACTLFGLSAYEALAGVTKNAAKALGLSDRGCLQIDMLADFCLWDINDPKDLVFNYGPNPLTRLVKKGKIINI